MVAYPRRLECNPPQRIDSTLTTEDSNPAQEFPNGNTVEGEIVEGEIVTSVDDLIHTIHAGMKLMDRGVIMCGRALRELRKRRDETQKEWDKFLRAEFSITYSTAHKWMDMADFDDEIGHDDSFPSGNSVWDNLPPRWTSQHHVISKLDAGEVIGAIMTEQITPLSTGKQIAEAIAQIRGEPITSPPTETYLARALSATMDARTQYAAGNAFKQDHDERDLYNLVRQIRAQLEMLESKMAGEDDGEPEWAAESAATQDIEPASRRAPKRDLAAEWRDEVQRCYMDAMAATNGYLLNDKAPKDIEPKTLFYGNKARAVKYASDELKEWWQTHPRPLARAEWIKAQKGGKLE